MYCGTVTTGLYKLQELTDSAIRSISLNEKGFPKDRSPIANNQGCQRSNCTMLSLFNQFKFNCEFQSTHLGKSESIKAHRATKAWTNMQGLVALFRSACRGHHSQDSKVEPWRPFRNRNWWCPQTLQGATTENWSPAGSSYWSTASSSIVHSRKYTVPKMAPNSNKEK